MSDRWTGVFPAVTTKFNDDYSLDYAGMERHFNYQIEAGVHGIVVTGTLGENGSLTAEEKQEVLKLAVYVSDGRVPVLAGVAENTTVEACRVVESGTEDGANGFMILPAMLYEADRRETLTHFRAVARASDLPMMIYNNPVAYKVDITPAMFAELADEPAFVAIKESSEDVRRITDIYNAVGDRYQIFTGVDNLALESILLGAVGWVAGLACAFPKETVALFELAKAARTKEARALYRWFMPLLHLDVSNKLVQNIKLAETIEGVGTETVRPPRLALHGDERNRIAATVESAIARRPDLTVLETA